MIKKGEFNMLIGTDPNGVYKAVKTTEEGVLLVNMEGEGGGGSSSSSSVTTLNASIQTVGTTATTISINKKVTEIEVANYSEEATVTLTAGGVTAQIGSNIATTLPINKNVTDLTLTSTAANTKVQIVVKGVE